MIGNWLHSRSERQTSTPSISGSTRSMIAASGGRHRRQIERLLTGRGRQRLVARITQDHAQCPEDLGLVVADEHPRPDAHGDAPTRRGDRQRHGEARALPRE